MAQLTAVFNDLLKQRESQPTRTKLFSVDNLDEFLKEAYRIASFGTIHSHSGTLLTISSTRAPSSHASTPTFAMYAKPTSRRQRRARHSCT